MASLLLEDIFEVEDLNPGGKKLFEAAKLVKKGSLKKKVIKKRYSVVFHR